MKTYSVWKRFLTGYLMLVLITSCTTVIPEAHTPKPTDTLTPPTNTLTPPIDTLTPPTDTPIPPTINPFSIVLTQDFLTAEAATPIPTYTPGPRSCEEVEGVCTELSFDGESCTFEGPELLKVEPITFLFFNESNVDVAFGVYEHSFNKTIQDMIDYLGEEPSPIENNPAWSKRITPWVPIQPGKSYTWKGVLGPRIHSILCVRLNPYGTWLGAGLTVEE